MSEACLEKMEANPEEMKSVAEHQEGVRATVIKHQRSRRTEGPRIQRHKEPMPDRANRIYSHTPSRDNIFI
jgi:hypothetical protein